MAWFEYDYSHSGQKRSHRKGVCLRVRHLTDDVNNAIKVSKCKRRTEYIDRVIVQELRPNKQVLLEVWCHTWACPKRRWNVFYVLVDENPRWVCESDVGRGYVSPKKINDASP